MHTDNFGLMGYLILLSAVLQRGPALAAGVPEGAAPGDADRLSEQRTPRQRRGLLGILANLLS